MKDVAPSREARPFADDLNQRRPWRQLVRQIAQVANFDGERLSAPAPTAMNIPVAGARRLRLGFGIEDGAWTTGHVKAICFRVEGAAGGSAPFGSAASIRMTSRPTGDRRPPSVDLPDGLETATVATSCLQSCDWGWSYWSDIQPEKIDPVFLVSTGCHRLKLARDRHHSDGARPAGPDPLIGPRSLVTSRKHIRDNMLNGQI